MSVIRLTGRMVNFSKLTFLTDNLHAIDADLDKLLGRDHQHQGMPVIIDCVQTLDLSKLLALLQRHELQPIAITEGPLSNQARTLGIAIFSADKSPKKLNAKNAATLAHLTENSVVRTGRQICAPAGDLILLKSANAGSECIASGNIHIYGNARGRLIAGCNGDVHARIFCYHFSPELVSIAGTYCLADDIPDHLLGQAVMASLDINGRLAFELMSEEPV